jgi:transcriptional regulator with XRE-family HTH domain
VTCPVNPLYSGGVSHRLGQTIRDRRVKLGKSQQVLGKAIGVCHQQIHRIECGSNELGIVRLLEIAEALDTSAVKLMTTAFGKSSPTAVTSERATIELVKRFDMLKPKERDGVVLLVRKLAGGI